MITRINFGTSEFTVGSNTCGSSVRVGGKCKIGVVFKPEANGQQPDTLTISDNASNAPQQVALSGIGKDAPLATPTPTVTSTPTATATETGGTPTATATATRTATATGTATRTPKPKRTATPTASPTPVPEDLNINPSSGNFGEVTVGQDKSMTFTLTNSAQSAGVAQASAEIFDVASNKFTLTTDLGGTDMNDARAKHTATAIGATTVLIAGGIDSSGNALATAEVFDLSTNSFTKVGSMHSARFDHAAAALSNGKILITGGEDGSGTTLNNAEIFDPGTNTFTLTTDPSLGGNVMNAARKLHTATPY